VLPILVFLLRIAGAKQRKVEFRSALVPSCRYPFEYPALYDRGMGYPAGTRFKDRIGKGSDSRWYFLCRMRHLTGPRRFLRGFVRRDEAFRFRVDHDKTHHSHGELVRGFRVGRDISSPRPEAPKRVAEVFREYVARIETLVGAGKRNPDTLRYYREMEEMLFFSVPGAKSGSSPFVAWYGDAESVDQRVVDAYADWRLKWWGTRGGRIVKELNALATAYRRAEIPMRWRVKVGDISPEKRERRAFDAVTIAEFIGAMEPGSLERAFAVTKIRTGMRSKELAALRVQDVDVERLEISFTLRNKRSPRPHRIAITADLVEELRPHLVEKGAEEFVFQIQGRCIGKDSLRVRFRRASDRMNAERKRQGLKSVPVIESIAQFRHAFMTAATAATGDIFRVSQYIGHSSVLTTQRYQVLTAEQVAERRRIAEVAAEAFPLRDGREDR
jgi:integrase